MYRKGYPEPLSVMLSVQCAPICPVLSSPRTLSTTRFQRSKSARPPYYGLKAVTTAFSCSLYMQPREKANPRAGASFFPSQSHPHPNNPTLALIYTLLTSTNVPPRRALVTFCRRYVATLSPPYYCQHAYLGGCLSPPRNPDPSPHPLRRPKRRHGRPARKSHPQAAQCCSRFRNARAIRPSHPLLLQR